MSKLIDSLRDAEKLRAEQQARSLADESIPTPAVENFATVTELVFDDSAQSSTPAQLKKMSSTGRLKRISA